MYYITPLLVRKENLYTETFLNALAKLLSKMIQKSQKIRMACNRVLTSSKTFYPPPAYI